MTDPNTRIERAIAQLGSEYEPPADWQSKVLAAIDREERPRPVAPRRRWWWFAIPAAALAPAALLIWLRLSTAPLAVVVELDRSDPAPAQRTRGPASDADGVHRVPPGTRVRLAARGGDGHRALWVYRDGRDLVAACPGASCSGTGVSLVLDRLGRYQVFALDAPSPLPAPSGDYDHDLAAATAAGATQRQQVIEVE